MGINREGKVKEVKLRKEMLIKFIYLLLFIFLTMSCTSGKKYVLTQEARQVVSRFKQIACSQKAELMADTPFHTPVFIFDSGIPGETVMILGGTHGDEPAGYEAGLRLVRQLEKKAPKQGKVIIIPMANRVADSIYNRRVPVPAGADRERGNLNRCYPGKENGLPMERMAWQITQLARKNNAGIFIDMHEARYFHLNTPKESYRKKGLGQTIIYYPNEPSTWLVMNLLDNINASIVNADEQFSALEEPILHSAAWWAGKYLNIAAFTFETMRKLSLQQRINYHLKLVGIVLRTAEVW